MLFLLLEFFVLNFFFLLSSPTQTEQGPEHASSDLFGSPVRTEKRALPKVPKDKEKDKVYS